MFLKKFIYEIHRLKPTDVELKKGNILLSEGDKWDIDIIEPTFNAYDGVIHQMVYCLDTIRLFYGFEQLNDIDENAPAPFKIWAINTNYGFYYAYNYLNDEIVLLDDAKNDKPIFYCAVSGSKFLDFLFVAATAEKDRITNGSLFDRNFWIQKLSVAAGGEKYREFSKIFLC